jgi:[Skp1-protein]-hydroxyproline N-acetylglucosaminyltransferase
MRSSDDDDDKVKKQQKRVKRGRNPGGVSLPSVVLTPAEAASQGAIELGAVLSILVTILYFVGFYMSANSLPEAPASPDWGAHMGENFNLALNSFDTPELDEELSSPQRGMAQAEHLDSVELEAPKSRWPVSLRDEGTEYETIIHPGDLKTSMSVPKFWSTPIHNNKLMTRETAMTIGTCIEPDPDTGSFQRGDKCPFAQRTLYIGIASYKDFECRSTAESAFKRAKYPERLRIGVVDQITEGEDAKCNAPIKPCEEDPEQALCKYKDQIDVYQMEASLSVGPVFARHLGYRMYRGEYYATQSDAHVTFVQDWDVSIIEQWESAKNEMAVLSTYLTDIQGSIDENGNSKRKTRPIMCNTVWEGGAQLHLRHASQPEKFPTIHGQPQLSPWWAAGYSFSRGHFIVNVPYDMYQPMIFQGEEMSIGIRGFSVGYDFYGKCYSVLCSGKEKRLLTLF